jgi:hypothetical protein
MHGFAYYVFFLALFGLLYDTFGLESKYFKKVYFEAKSYAAWFSPNQNYQLSGQNRPYRISPVPPPSEPK